MGCNASKPPETMDYGGDKGPLTAKEEKNEDQDHQDKSFNLEDTSLEGMKHLGLDGRTKNVPPFNPNYPSPKPPDDTKEELCGHEDFAPIDNNAKSVPAKDKERYQTLLPRLLQGTNNDVQKVRAIYSYTGSINYNDPQVTQAKEGDTPTYYIKMIKEKKGDVPTFFTILCRRAGIPCVILDGLGKGKNYVPGMSEKDMRSKWNAVHVNDNWRPVHVEWGHQDNDGKNKDKKDDFYFLTDPDRFVVNCFPDDYQWQLLADPLTKNEWLNLPNFRPAFFDLHMQLVKPKSGLVRAVKGKAEVEISVPPNMMDKIMVGYGLQYKGAISKKDRDKNDTSREMDSNRAMESSRGMDSSLKDEGKVERPKSVPPRLERYVFLNRKSPRLHYTLTLPVAGKYIFEITGNHMEEEERGNNYGAAKTLLCQFRVLSENDPYDEDCEPYPDAPEFGWGPTPHCARLGITPITHLEGIIYINPKEKKDIKFRLTEDLDFRTSLCHNYLPHDELKDMSSWRQPKDDEMIVTVGIPEEGVFGLKIEAARADSQQFFEIANYLLRQHSRGGVSEKVRSKMLRAKLNYAIENGPTEKALKDAMDMFDCYNVPDQGEMAKAQERLEHYWTIKRELNFSCRRRNNGVLDKWIKAGNSSKFVSELKEDIRQAEDMKEKLGKLHGYLHPIAKMQPKTIQEIRTYQHPKPVTKDVMTATYILLGEKKDGLEDWSNIQVLMARSGKDGLQKRILDRRPEDVNEKDVEVADVILEPHNINEAREASAGTAAFYRWAKEFIHFTRSPDNSYHKEGIMDRDTYRETHGISVNRHHEHIEYERHKYDSPRVTLNTGRSPERKQDTKAHQTEKPSHQDPKEQNEELNTNHDLENSSTPKDTQYQNHSPRRFQRKVTPDDTKPEPSPAYNNTGLKRDKQADKLSPKMSLDEKPIHRESDISKPKPEQRDKSVDDTGNKKRYPKNEKHTTVDKQIEDITDDQPNGEDVKQRDATPERKDEVTSRKKIQKEKDQLQQKPIIPAQHRDENKKPIQEMNRKDREAKPRKKNEVVEEKQERKEDVPKQEENQTKDKDDRQKKEVDKFKPDKNEKDKKKNEKQEMENSEEQKRRKDEREKEESEEKVKKEVNEKEREKKEKDMIDKERRKVADKEKVAKLKETEEKEKSDREEREKNKQGIKEKEQERRQREKEDRLKRDKEEKERKDKEKQELEKGAKIKKENEEKERKQKERQKREEEEQLKREKVENEGKEKAERQKKNGEKKDQVEKEEQDRKEKEEKQKKENKKPDKTAREDKERKDKEDKQRKEKDERDKRDKEEKDRKEKEKEEKEKKEKEERDKKAREDKERKDKEDKQKKEKAERDKIDREEKERKEKEKKEKEKEERDNKEKEAKERKEKEKQSKEKEEKEKRDRMDKERKEKQKQKRENEERERKDKEEKEKKEKEAKQEKEKEDTERREKRDKEKQQKEEKEKREREDKQKSEKKSEKEKDQLAPVRSHSYYFFDLY